MIFYFILWFIIMVVVSPLSELVCYISNLSLYVVLIPLDMNLDRVSGVSNATVGSFSIDQEFPSLVE